MTAPRPNGDVRVWCHVGQIANTANNPDCAAAARHDSRNFVPRGQGKEDWRVGAGSPVRRAPIHRCAIPWRASARSFEQSEIVPWPLWIDGPQTTTIYGDNYDCAEVGPKRRKCEAEAPGPSNAWSNRRAKPEGAQRGERANQHIGFPARDKNEPVSWSNSWSTRRCSARPTLSEIAARRASGPKSRRTHRCSRQAAPFKQASASPPRIMRSDPVRQQLLRRALGNRGQGRQGTPRSWPVADEVRFQETKLRHGGTQSGRRGRDGDAGFRAGRDLVGGQALAAADDGAARGPCGARAARSPGDKAATGFFMLAFDLRQQASSSEVPPISPDEQDRFGLWILLEEREAVDEVHALDRIAQSQRPCLAPSQAR